MDEKQHQEYDRKQQQLYRKWLEVEQKRKREFRYKTARRLARVMYKREDLSAAEIGRRLDEAMITRGSDRQVQNWIADLAPDAEWRIGVERDDDDDTPPVLPALASVIEQSTGRRTMLRADEVRVTARIMAAVPGIPADKALLAAQLLLTAEDDEQVRAVHQYLAFEPWTEAGAGRYANALNEGWIESMKLLMRHETEDDLRRDGAFDEIEEGDDGQ